MTDPVHKPRTVYIIDKENEKSLSASRLFEDEDALNYDPVTGEVIVSRWQTKKVNLQKGKKAIDKPDDYVVLSANFSVKNELKLDDLPKKVNVVCLIPQRFESIEYAMRLQHELMSDYDAQGGLSRIK